MIATDEIVRARLLEAASIAGKLPAGPRQNACGFWPAFTQTFEEMAQWGSQRLAEEREMRAQRLPPSSAAISRHDEVLDWMSDILKDEQVRRTVWTWAICKISGMSFTHQCDKRGWVRGSALRRLRGAIDRISGVIAKKNILLRLPDEIYVRQIEGVSGTNVGMVGTRADAPPISPTFEIQDGDRPRDLLTSPEAIQEFGDHLMSVNRQRRRDQEARKRKLLGIA